MVEAESALLPHDALLPRDMRRALPIALLRAREAVVARYRPLLRANDLTEQQWRVMLALQGESSLDATALSETTCVHPPSLTRIIKGLAERGLISRERDRGDARKIMLALTPAGLELICKLMPDTENAYTQLESRYGRKRIEDLLALLQELTELGAFPR